MKAEELLRRYAAGDRDFHGVNLRGQSFKGKDLSRANFSDADIRGTNFTNTKLIGANFSGCKAGLQRRWVFFFVIVALLLLGLSGLTSVISGNYLSSLLIIASKQITIVPGLVVLIIYLIFLTIIICQNFEIAARITLIAVILVLTVSLAINVVSFGSINSFDNIVKTSVSSIHVDTKRPLTNAIAITAVGAAASSFAAAIANTTIVTSVVTASFSLALLEVIANLRFTACIFALFLPYFVFLRFFLVQTTAYNAAFATAVFGYNVSGSIVSRDGSSGLVMMSSGFETKISSAIGSAIAVIIILLSTYISQQILANKKKYNLIRKIIMALAVGGGTSFRHADLTDANFTYATLKSTDFRRANLTRTRWHQAKKLDCIRPGTTYLQYLQFPQILRLLTTGQGQGENFDGKNIRGVNLQGANLADASFIGTDLSKANLQNTDLSRAKLVQTQLDETDLTGAILTGACIKDWGITNHTQLHGVGCEYVFMRVPTEEDPNPRRKPDNWNETFSDGGFSDFIKPIVDTLDLYHNQDVDPRTIAISFKQLAENHPDAELDIVAMEKRGEDNFLLRVKTAPDADSSELSAEYFSTYNQVKSLPKNHVQILLAVKDRHIQSLENTIENFINTFNRPTIYAETYYNQGDTMSEKSDTSNYDLRQSKFGGGFAGTKGTQSGGTFYDYSSNPNLSQAAAEIQQLLYQLEATNPTNTSAEKMVVATKAVDEIENNPALKARVVAALNSANTEAFKQAISHPLAKNIMPIIEEWTQAE